METWNEAQKWEAEWWGKCLNTYGEEEKQLLYAEKMGLRLFHDGRSPYNIDARHKNILDIGGGPVSMLLKTVNRGSCLVVDPMPLPEWVKLRYAEAGISLMKSKGEDFVPYMIYNEVWIYNCLQHTEDPATVIDNALHSADYVRIFEWLDTKINVGHPHSFSKEQLDDLLGGYGRVEELSGQRGCYGKCYYGVFTGSKS